jgi:hypothetical protein
MNTKLLVFLCLILAVMSVWVFSGKKNGAQIPNSVPVEKVRQQAIPLPFPSTESQPEGTKQGEIKREPEDVRYGPLKVSASESAETPRRHTQSCRASTEPLRETPAGGIVKWTDENGITHYENFEGEEQPADKKLVVRSPHTKDYFSLDIQFPPKSQLPFSTSDIQRKATSVYEIYRSWLDDRWLSRAEIRLLFFADKQRYEDYRDKFFTEGSNYIAGFYVSQKNQAVILSQGSREGTFGVMVHEIAHIINHQVFGDLPRWLNEGLATHIEYLERNGSNPPLSNRQLTDLKAYTKSQVISAVSVADLLATTHSDWSSDNLATYYQLSQTLVHFMLLPENRDAMLPILRLTAEQKCQDKDIEGIIEEHYSGGISALAENFNRWLDN